MGQPQPGALFAGRYRVERELARGGMGVVYAAEHLETEQAVALKVLFESVGASPAAMEGFRREARVAARLDSEHVVRVLDAGVDAETQLAFLAMERLEGVTVAELLRARGHLDPQAVADIFRDLGRALDRAHRHKDKSGALRPIVHRDLKPENLFLAEVPEKPPRLNVLDFGLAKIVVDENDVSGDIKGTPLYMAYEQVAGRPVTPRTDIWSMGLVAFRLRTGKHYWLAANLKLVPPAILFAEILDDPLPTATERATELGVHARVPHGFDAWFGRCVARDAASRFATAREAANVLHEILGSPTTEALALPSPAEGTARERSDPPRKPRSLRGIALAIALVTVVAVAYFATRAG